MRKPLFYRDLGEEGHRFPGDWGEDITGRSVPATLAAIGQQEPVTGGASGSLLKLTHERCHLNGD